METLGMILVGLGVIVSLIGSIWFLVVAFRESVLWGLGCLLLSPVSLIFLILHFGDSIKPFGVSFLGSVLTIIGFIIMPESM